MHLKLNVNCKVQTDPYNIHLLFVLLNYSMHNEIQYEYVEYFKIIMNLFFYCVLENDNYLEIAPLVSDAPWVSFQ